MTTLQHQAWERKSLQPPSAQFKTILQLTLAPPQEIRLFLPLYEIVWYVEVQNIPFLSPLT